jgi:S-layer homology domain
MSNDQRPHRLRDDEPIALLVAFLAFGAIFAWAFSQGRGGFDPSSWLSGSFGGNQGGVFGSLTNPPGAPTPAVSPQDGTPPTRTNPITQPPIAGVAPTRPRGQGSAEAELNAPQVPFVPGVAVPPGAGVPSPTMSPIAPSPSLGVSPSPAAPGALKPAVPGSPIAFSDVPAGAPVAAYIAALSAKGIVSGFPDGTYKPEQPVTRAEYAVQLQKAFTNPDQLAPKPFADVPQGYWAATAIDKVVKSDFMSGYSEDQSFRPDQRITRTEAIVAMVRGLGIQEPPNSDALLQGFTDQAQVPKWARGRVAAAVQAGLLDPNVKAFNPSQPATRGDVAEFVYKGLEVRK